MNQGIIRSLTPTFDTGKESSSSKESSQTESRSQDSRISMKRTAIPSVEMICHAVAKLNMIHLMIINALFMIIIFLRMDYGAKLGSGRKRIRSWSWSSPFMRFIYWSNQLIYQSVMTVILFSSVWSNSLNFLSTGNERRSSSRWPSSISMSLLSGEKEEEGRVMPEWKNFHWLQTEEWILLFNLTALPLAWP